ncbi:MAG: hypothetical protein ACRELY_28990, partial [Polyangiaceae bacterium]
VRKRTMAAAAGVFGGVALFIVGIFALHAKMSASAGEAKVIETPVVASTAPPPPSLLSSEPMTSAVAPTVALVASSASKPTPPRPDKSHKTPAPKSSNDPNSFFTHRTL